MGNAPEPAAAASAASPPPPSPAVAGARRRTLLLLGALLAVAVAVAVAVAAYILPGPRPGGTGPAGATAPAAAPAAATATAASPTPAPTPTPTPEPPAVALNILLIGSDSRVNERAAAANGTTSDQRGDALVLIHLPADRKSVYGISIMRDLWVDIPGHGTAKVNAALELGGLPLMTRTVEALLGAHIDHTVMLDFQGFAAMTDALGGVDVNIKQSFTATADDKVHFPAGVNHLNGLQALAFVRERHAFADGDYQRVRNQQTFLKAVMAKLASEGGLADRGTVRKLIKTVLPHVTLDASFTLESLENLAFGLRSTPPGRGVFFTLPTAGTGTSRDGQSIVLKDPAATAALSAALRSGTLASYVAANNLQNGN
ncbi:LCP family protein [Arthrobacter humicola]|uniref:LCP family protein n=1 Tax=Arthrobacter humicola TaxID=409291 RepID=UPI001FAB8D5E|nr:LCP family protein [Arthrobacter humicola]